MMFLTGVWTFLKAHWQAMLLVVIVALGYAWMKHQQSTFAKAMDDMNSANQAEIAKITQARDQETKDHAAQLQALQDSISKIQSDYAAAQDALKQQRVAESNQIVKKYGNDAEGLANLLANRMNFTVTKFAP